MKNDCVFCAILAGEIPSFKIYEDDFVVSFLDVNPCSFGHALVVPKEHVACLLDASDELLAAVIARVKKVGARLMEALPCDGFNVLQNNGEAAGQSVRHLHFHVVPRRKDVDAPLAFTSGKGDFAALEALAGRVRFGV